MEKILLNITSEQTIAGISGGALNFITEGEKTNKNDTTVLSFLESEVFGFPGHTTAITLDGETITMERKGLFPTRFVFVNGKPFVGLYTTEFGTTSINILPIKVAHKDCDNGGEIELVYQIGVEKERFCNKYSLKYKNIVEKESEET